MGVLGYGYTGSVGRRFVFSDVGLECCTINRRSCHGYRSVVRVPLAWGTPGIKGFVFCLVSEQKVIGSVFLVYTRRHRLEVVADSIVVLRWQCVLGYNDGGVPRAWCALLML